MNNQRIKNWFKVRGTLERVFFALYCAALFIVSALHEPWFDEAQAWQIARCASLRDILFVIPHYEGHPPLWHLLLVPLARSGMPFEVGLKVAGFLLAASCAYLILFRSPFPRPMRLLLPFNFFLFYQYGVMVRPYMLIVVLLLLLAMAHPGRDEHPVRYIVLLGILCLTHAYGMAIAFGVALAFCADILREKGLARFARELISDPRTRSLLALPVLAAVIVLCILPRPDTYNPTFDSHFPLANRLVYAVFGMPGDCFVTCSSWFANDRALLQNVEIPALGLVSTCVFGMAFWVGAYLLSSKRNFKYLWMPYFAFAIFGGAVYLAAHHVGVALGILLFWLWVAQEDLGRCHGLRVVRGILKPSKRDARIARSLGAALLAACLLVPVVWTVTSCAIEARESYGYSRDFARFLKSSGLDGSLIFNNWESEEGKNGARSINTCMYGDISSLLAYFDDDILANVDKGYLEYRSASEAENEAKRREWATLGTPDLLIGYVDLGWVFGDAVTMDDYSLVFIERSDHVWKGREDRSNVLVYLRNDRFEDFGLEPIELSPEEMFKLTGNYTLTSETMDSIRSGELTIDEVLDRMGL